VSVKKAVLQALECIVAKVISAMFQLLISQANLYRQWLFYLLYYLFKIEKLEKI